MIPLTESISYDVNHSMDLISYLDAQHFYPVEDTYASCLKQSVNDNEKSTMKGCVRKGWLKSKWAISGPSGKCQFPSNTGKKRRRMDVHHLFFFPCFPYFLSERRGRPKCHLRELDGANNFLQAAEDAWTMNVLFLEPTGLIQLFIFFMMDRCWWASQIARAWRMKVCFIPSY